MERIFHPLQILRQALNQAPKVLAVVFSLVYIIALSRWYSGDSAGVLITLMGIFIIFPLSLAIFSLISIPIKIILDIILVFCGLFSDTRSYDERSESFYDSRKAQGFHGRYEQSETYGSNSVYDSETAEAMRLFGFKVFFTLTELKDRRRQLIRRAHPDMGGSTEDAAKINAAYDILERYASN